jgi:low temperature requirement protein LtrA
MSQAHASPDLPPHAHGRKATWFELFFDLVIVVAVAQLSGALDRHFDWAGAAGSALLVLVV